MIALAARILLALIVAVALVAACASGYWPAIILAACGAGIIGYALWGDHQDGKRR